MCVSFDCDLNFCSRKTCFSARSLFSIAYNILNLSLCGIFLFPQLFFLCSLWYVSWMPLVDRLVMELVIVQGGGSGGWYYFALLIILFPCFYRDLLFRSFCCWFFCRLASVSCPFVHCPMLFEIFLMPLSLHILINWCDLWYSNI